MTPSTFRQRCRNEWRRLNPRYVEENDGAFTVFLATWRETVPGYVAPVRFVWWLLVKSWRRG